jgi:hypothetical protein
MPRSLPPARPVNRVTEQAAQTGHESDQVSCAAADVRDGRPTHYSAEMSTSSVRISMLEVEYGPLGYRTHP